MARWDEMSYNTYTNRRMYEKDFFENNDMSWLELMEYVYEDEDLSIGAEMVTIVVDF